MLTDSVPGELAPRLGTVGHPASSYSRQKHTLGDPGATYAMGVLLFEPHLPMPDQNVCRMTILQVSHSSSSAHAYWTDDTSFFIRRGDNLVAERHRRLHPKYRET